LVQYNICWRSEGLGQVWLTGLVVITDRKSTCYKKSKNLMFTSLIKFRFWVSVWPESHLSCHFSLAICIKDSFFGIRSRANLRRMPVLTPLCTVSVTCLHLYLFASEWLAFKPRRNILRLSLMFIYHASIERGTRTSMIAEKVQLLLPALTWALICRRIPELPTRTLAP